MLSKFLKLPKRALSVLTNNVSRLDGKVAIVTASTEGIGFSIAKRLLKDGAKVVVSSRKKGNVEKAVEELKKHCDSKNVEGLVCHVGKDTDRKNLIEMALQKYGKLDVLVSNAAANPAFGPMLDTTEDQWDKIFEVNVKAAFFLFKDAVPALEKSGNGSAIFVSSIAGFTPLPMLGPYSVSKTALLGLTKVLARECSSQNIRVNGIAPGLIRTNFSEALWKNPELAEEVTKEIPLGRFGESDECAGLVSFLASDDSTYITGENMLVAGGMTSRL